MGKRPNIVFVFSDQHRASATGYHGNKDVITPNLDKLEKQSINFAMAISGCPVCSPYRASLLTGQYPWKHGVFINDVPLDENIPSMGKVLKSSGYSTAYIGKWHVDGHGRKNYIPSTRRQGFDYWKVLECTHDYNSSQYYDDDTEIKQWDGYDVFAQTKDAIEYIKDKRRKDSPFALFLSWGPPHDPYLTAPEDYRKMYDPDKITLSPNVTPAMEEYARLNLAGYYAHITAIDSQVGEMVKTLKEEGLEENTIFIYTSDHGDMIGSQGMDKKQKPWDESINVPFLLRYPDKFGYSNRKFNLPFNAPDIMPTILGLCGISIPETVQGTDFKPYLTGQKIPEIPGALLSNIKLFGEWKALEGGREHRGIRTIRYTYVRDSDGPWLLYDNFEDPHQMNNLCEKDSHIDLQKKLEKELQKLLDKYGDDFRKGDYYMENWGYELDKRGNITYEKDTD